jgi:hypothetical protein
VPQTCGPNGREVTAEGGRQFLNREVPGLAYFRSSTFFLM